METRLLQRDRIVKFLEEESDSIRVVYDSGESLVYYKDQFRDVRGSIREDAEDFVEEDKKRITSMYQSKCIALFFGISCAICGGLWLGEHEVALIFPTLYSLTQAITNYASYKSDLRRCRLPKSPSIRKLKMSDREIKKYELFLENYDLFLDYFNRTSEDNIETIGFSGDINDLYDASYRDVKKLLKQIKKGRTW